MKGLDHAMLWNASEILTALFLVLVCILMKKHGVRGGKYLLTTPGKTLNFKMSLDVLALKNLCLWCEF